MRQKNTNSSVWFYVVGVVILAVLLWFVSREIPFEPKRVEQEIENTFADR